MAAFSVFFLEFVSILIFFIALKGSGNEEFQRY
jgi:hypothetical protein